MWLELSPGKPNLKLLKMAREGLDFELRNALHKVKTNKKPFSKEGIPIQCMGEERLVAIDVIPLVNIIEPHFLILFRDTSIQFDKHTKANKVQVIPHFKQRRELTRLLNQEREQAASREDIGGSH